MPTIYLETTIPSYLVARPSQNLIIAAHQQITHDWWRDVHEHFDIYISEVVLTEIRVGDQNLAARRLAIVEKLPILQVNDEVQNLVNIYAQRLRFDRPCPSRLAPYCFCCRIRNGLSGNMELCPYS